MKQFVTTKIVFDILNGKFNFSNDVSMYGKVFFLSSVRVVVGVVFDDAVSYSTNAMPFSVETA